MVKPFYQLPAFKNMIIPLYSPRVKQMAGGKFGDRDAVALDLLEEVGFERDSSVPFKAAGRNATAMAAAGSVNLTILLFMVLYLFSSWRVGVSQDCWRARECPRRHTGRKRGRA